MLLHAFARFVVEGIGTPAPVAPPQHLVVGGLYRFVRNPMYVAVTATIVGQAALLGRPALLLYAALFMAVVAAFVYGYEQPVLRERFGAEYDAYRRNVPAWWPRLRPWKPLALQRAVPPMAVLEVRAKELGPVLSGKPGRGDQRGDEEDGKGYSPQKPAFRRRRPGTLALSITRSRPVARVELRLVFPLHGGHEEVRLSAVLHVREVEARHAAARDAVGLSPLGEPEEVRARLRGAAGIVIVRLLGHADVNHRCGKVGTDGALARLR